MMMTESSAGGAMNVAACGASSTVSAPGVTQCPCPRQLVVRDRLIDEPLKLVEESALARFRIAVRADSDPAAEEARAIDERQPEGGHVLSDLALTDERPVEARPAAARED